MDFQDQYLLRVKRGGELDKILQTISGQPATADAINDAAGIKHADWLARSLPKWFDNVAVTHSRKDGNHTAYYTDVRPQRVQVVTSDVTFNQAAQAVLTSGDGPELESKFRWPVAPPLIEPMENFDTPLYYERMKAKVLSGSHVSLEGAPSVGKDTAVEQLAAELGRPLVTIGGDAGFRTADLKGNQQMVSGTSFFDVGDYVAAAVNGWWVLLTEVNAADPSAIMYINRQLAAPYVVNLGGKSYPVHKDFRLFITYNHGLVGTKPLPQSFKDRFFSIKVPFFTKAQLRQRLAAMGWSNLPAHEMANSIIVDYGIAMWKAYEDGKMRYQITTRRLKDAISLVIMGYPVVDALTYSVIDAIDSPIEAKAAQSVLSSVITAAVN